jgi:hypothetical protein
MCFSATLSTTHLIASTSDITTLPIIGSNIIFKEAGYFVNSAVSSCLTRQALHCFRKLYQLHVLNMTTVAVPTLDVRSTFFTPEVDGRPVN